MAQVEDTTTTTADGARRQAAYDGRLLLDRDISFLAMDPLGRLDVEAGKAMTERFQFGLPTVFGVTTIVAVLLWGLLTVPAVLRDIASLLAVVSYLLVMFVVWSLLCLISVLVVVAGVLATRFVARRAARWLAPECHHGPEREGIQGKGSAGSGQEWVLG